MKKGFTLIELLAVIVILAIIALIATPIVLNIINDTKESAQLRSAEMYLNAVEQTIARNNMNGTFNPVSCNINENGNLECDGETEEVIVEIDGEKPTGGSISFKDGKINKVSLSFNNDKLVIKNEAGELIYDEKICKAIAPIEQPIPTPGDDLESIDSITTKVVGVQATEDNPYASGAVYSCDLGDGPRIFYVLWSSSAKVSLIMNENLGGLVLWAESGDNSEGPVTANAALVERTSKWTKLKEVGGTVELPSDSMVGGDDWFMTNLAWGTDYAGYWTSTAHEGWDEESSRHFAYVYYYNGNTAACGVDGDGDPDSTAACGSSGIRPVITIPINQL